MIIAAYNASQCLERAPESALSQFAMPTDIIVVDNHSEDSTAAVVERAGTQHSNVRLMLQAETSGPVKATSAAFDQAKGEWPAILDADDAWEPGRLDKMVFVDHKLASLHAGRLRAHAGRRAGLEGHIASPSLDNAKLPGSKNLISGLQDHLQTGRIREMTP